MEIITADLCDQYPDELIWLNIDLKHYGTKENFAGQIVTLKLYEDNSFVRKLLEQDGNGKVLVVDGGGSTRCALVGDNLAKLAIENNWEAIVVYGCIRDSKVINTMPVAIKALGTCPVKSVKRNVGLTGEKLVIQGAVINHNGYIYGDSDGVVIADKKLL